MSEAVIATPESLLVHPHPREWSSADLLLIPEDGPKCEIVEGNLLVSPSPTKKHQYAILALIGLLEDSAPAGVEVSFDLDVDLGRDVFRPDVLVLSADAAGKDRPFAAADVLLAVEVTSPSSRSMDRIIKPAALAEAGVPNYWRADIDADPYVEMFELDGSVYRLTHMLRAGTSTYVNAPFPVEFDPAVLLRPTA